ncbi:MAG: segregation/condensation protein A [Acidiferrobacterales bacterium]|nr:segregation/condensation protein A [Acidiferrobacterales bacterium]
MNQPENDQDEAVAAVGSETEKQKQLTQSAEREVDSDAPGEHSNDASEVVGQSNETDANSVTQQQTTVAEDENEEAQNILINGELLDKLPDDLFIPPDALEVFLETFQGPLDLLLYLIRKQNLDILNIPVAKITSQYMEYVELMRHFRLDLAAEYLVMAATLAEIKSRTLLPRPQTEDEGEEEDPRAALIRRLQEYERFSQAARDIDDRPRVERELYLVKAEFEDHAPVKVEARASLNDVVVAFRNVMERTTNNKNWAVGHERLTVREKMTQILDRVRNKETMRFEDLFDPEEGRLGLVVSFMAVLELCRDSMLIVVQNEPFAPIHLKSIAGE